MPCSSVGDRGRRMAERRGMEEVALVLGRQLVPEITIGVEERVAKADGDLLVQDIIDHLAHGEGLQRIQSMGVAGQHTLGHR